MLPEDVNGLPLHPLAVHATVVLVPLTALLALLFVLPRFRSWARVPLLLVSLASVVSVFVSKQSGKSFQERLGLEDAKSNPVAAAVRVHAQRANVLFLIMATFAVIAVVAFLVSQGSRSYTGLVAVVMSVLLVVGAGAIAFQTYRVGESGAQAVWGSSGS
ncbi:MAG: DUF2231 domain-containing protein [Nocardioidaceae bacterium]